RLPYRTGGPPRPDHGRRHGSRLRGRTLRYAHRPVPGDRLGWDPGDRLRHGWIRDGVRPAALKAYTPALTAGIPASSVLDRVSGVPFEVDRLEGTPWTRPAPLRNLAAGCPDSRDE